MNSKVFFRVYCKTEFRQNVYIVGNIKALGEWNPYHGLKLVTNPQIYPMWLSDYPIDVEENQVLEYKLVIMDGSNCYWETCVNRQIKTRSFKQIAIVTYNNPENEVCGLKNFSSDNDLQQIDKYEAKKVNVKVKDYMSYTDSDSDLGDEEKSQKTEDSIMFPSAESFRSSELQVFDQPIVRRTSFDFGTFQN